MVHLSVMGAIDLVKNGKAEGLPTNKQIEAVKTILDIYDKVKGEAGLFKEETYGLKNVQELTAQMLDSRQRKTMNLSVLDRVVNAANVLRSSGEMTVWNRVKEEMMLSEGGADEFANDTEAKQVVTEFLQETLGGTDGIELVHNTQEEGQRVTAEQAYNTELMAGKNVPERANKIAQTNGIVSSGLANKSVNIVSAEAHPFDVNKKTAELKKDIVAYAEDNGIIGTMNNEETNGKGSITISKGSIGKFVDDSATNKSVDKDIHLSVLPKIRSIIAESVLAETHPDYNRGKDGKHSPDNGFNKDVLIHRLYGAVELNGEVYRVKTTIKEVTSRDAMKAYSYEVTEIELLPGQKEEGENRLHRNGSNSITGAKLLQNIEKSYDKGKKLLDESKNNAELMQVFHGSAAVFDHFDSSHFMEGEGSMVYGAGHYTTNVEGTGRFYAGIAQRNKSKGAKFIGPNPFNVSKDAIEWAEYWVGLYGFDGAKEHVRSAFVDKTLSEKGEEAAKFLMSCSAKDFGVEGIKRQLYEIEIPDDNGSNYLGWNEVYKNGACRAIVSRIAEVLDKKGIDRKQKQDNIFYDSSWKKIEDSIERGGNIYFDGEEIYRALSNLIGSDKDASSILAEAGLTGVKVPTGNKKGGDGRGMNYVVFKDGDLKIKNRVEFLESKGTVYGWAEGNKIHLTPEGLNPNTPIHEYTHLWAKAIQKKAPELWNNVKQLLKGNPLVKEILGENYGIPSRTKSGKLDAIRDRIAVLEQSSEMTYAEAEDTSLDKRLANKSDNGKWIARTSKLHKDIDGIDIDGKEEMMLSEGGADEFANDTEAKQAVTDFVTETIGGTDGLNIEYNTQEEGQKVAEEQSAEMMAGAKVETARGIRLDKEEYAGLSSSLMTQANTYFHANELEGSRNIVKKIRLFGDNAYLWSSENGHEFFIEKRLPLDDKYSKDIDKLLETYGTDYQSEDIINAVQGFRNGKIGNSDFIGALKRAGANNHNKVGNRPVGQRAENTNRARDNVQTQRDITGNTLTTPNGTVYGWAEGNKIHLTPEGLNPNTPIHEYTHLWAKAIQKKAPELWNNVKQLLKGNPLVKEILGEKGYEGLDEDGLYSEVLSRVSGKANAGKLEEAAQRLLDAGHSQSKVKQMLSNFKEAIKKTWSWIGKELFGKVVALNKKNSGQTLM